MLITVIVPTRNRGDTLRATLRTLTAIDDDRIEIVVSDNFSIDGTRDIVAEVSDPRLSYLNTGRPLGMSQNWEFALAHAKGDWITYLGDDDGMLPDAFARVREIARETGVRAVRGATCNYIWPSLSADGRGKLYLPTQRRVGIVDAATELARVLAGGVHYTRLPVPYNGGFVERALVESGRDATGRFFRSRIPDVYSGVLLAHLLNHYYWSDVPFAVNGASIHSTGSSTFRTSDDKGRAEAVLTFMKEDNIPFHPAVPLGRDGSLPRSLEVLILESWHQVRDLHADILPLTPDAQMAAVAGGAGTRQIREWLEDFASVHGLASASPPRGAAMSRMGRRVRAIAGQVWHTEWHSDPGSDPLPTVEEATRVTGAVLAAAPSPAGVAVRNLLRRSAKLLKRGR